MALILGLESSCDDTAAALVTSDRQILAQAVVGQNEAHRPFGGVVPEIAARAHVEILPDLIREVLEKAGKSVGDLDAIAATAGPGLIGGVMVALLAGKGLALGTGKPVHVAPRYVATRPLQHVEFELPALRVGDALVTGPEAPEEAAALL
jgi:N6-L-threonylcarbamoyladenine synthase